MATRHHLTRLDRLLPTRAMAPTSGEILQTPAARTARSIRFNQHRSPTWGRYTGSADLAEHPSFKGRFWKNVVKVHQPLVNQVMGAHKEPYEVVIHIQVKSLLKICPRRLRLPLMVHPKRICPGYQSSWATHPYRPTFRQALLVTSGRAGLRDGFRRLRNSTGRLLTLKKILQFPPFAPRPNIDWLLMMDKAYQIIMLNERCRENIDESYRAHDGNRFEVDNLNS